MNNNKTILNSNFDIESGYTYIITIAITSHGCILTTNPTQNYNIQFHSSTHKDITFTEMTPIESSVIPDHFFEVFRKDRPSITDKHPPHFNNLPYDKIIADNAGIIDTLLDTTLNLCGSFQTNGIWLVSVHRKPTETLDNTYEYIYPNDDMGALNLFNIDALKHFNEHFSTNSFKPLYDNLKKNNSIRNNNNNTWNVQLNHDKTRIKLIRLTYILDLIKKILGYNCQFNVFDYSCSGMCLSSKDKMPNIQSQELSLQPYFSAGRFKKRRTTKNRRKYKKKEKLREEN